MTPDPHPTLIERAEELETAAKFAEGTGDYDFAKDCTDQAKTLREQAATVEARRLDGG